MILPSGTRAKRRRIVGHAKPATNHGSQIIADESYGPIVTLAPDQIPHAAQRCIKVIRSWRATSQFDRSGYHQCPVYPSIFRSEGAARNWSSRTVKRSGINDSRASKQSATLHPIRLLLISSLRLSSQVNVESGFRMETKGIEPSTSWLQIRRSQQSEIVSEKTLKCDFGATGVLQLLPSFL